MQIDELEEEPQEFKNSAADSIRLHGFRRASRGVSVRSSVLCSDMA